MLFRSLPPFVFASAALLCSGPLVLAQAFDCDGIEPVDGTAITLELVSGALARPVDVIAPPGDAQRLFVVQQTGEIRIIRLADDTLAPQPFLDIPTVACCGEKGLLGLAFHPDYAQNGTFFVNYTRARGAVCTASPPVGCTADRDSETVLARFRVSAGDPDVADLASQEVLLSFCQPYSNHNGGWLGFSPLDGYLYMSTGDGGSGGDPCGSAQRVNSFLGKLLRFDVDGDSAYAIPPTNPYAALDDGILDEIWAIGLRNPWRCSFDPVTGDLWIGDVGQGTWEEIDFQASGSAGGENYEWKVREGDHAYQGATFGPGARVKPVFEYPHSNDAIIGRSVTGGYVYRGCRMPDLDGRYFFADYNNDWVRSFKLEDGQATDVRDHTAELNAGIAPSRIQNVSAFGVDGRGDLYIADVDNGDLYRVVPTVPNNPPTARIASDPSPAAVTLGDGGASIRLDGSASDDGDGGAQGLTYSWRKVNINNTFTIASASSAATDVRFTAPGVFSIRLTVSDGRDTSSQTIEVTVADDPRPQFRRGDANGDAKIDISDGVRILVFLFVDAATELGCEDAADADDGGGIEMTDAVYTFNFLFSGGQDIPEPTACGRDASEDALGCALYPCP
jgi:glucose/arabinose dehydrogenase